MESVRPYIEFDVDNHEFNQQMAREAAWKLIDASLEAVNPKRAVENFVQKDGEVLTVGGIEYDLSKYNRVLVLGAGKASSAMAEAITEIIPDSEERPVEGLVITKYDHGPEGGMIGKVKVAEASHPATDDNGLTYTREMISLAESADERTLVFDLLSGGGSALREAPSGDLTPEETKIATKIFQNNSANIQQQNILRKHMSSVKGGQFGRLLSETGATTVNLALSDVIGEGRDNQGNETQNLDVIASGPDYPDPSSYQDAMDTIFELGVMEELEEQTPGVIEHIKKGIRGEVPDTPSEPIPNVQNLVVGDNRIAAEAASAKAEALGFESMVLSEKLEGDVDDVYGYVASIAREMAEHGDLDKPVCLVLGGETTVKVRDKSGIGGRNQQMAVSSALKLNRHAVDHGKGIVEADEVPNALIVAFGTDGTDGPNDAAGGFADSELVRRAEQLGIDPKEFLDRNDTYNLLAELGEDYHIKTNPTGTNVCDLTFIMAWPIKK